MTPLDRVLGLLAQRTPVERDDPARPQAAVALIVTPSPDRLLLIQRAERAGDPWSGHLALPGGRRGPGDADLLETAIRETSEETGITLARAWCQAQLDDLVPLTPTSPAIVVRPYLFRVERASTPAISGEVVAATWLPFERLAADDALVTRVVSLRGTNISVVGYQLDEGFLWGMTERILTPVVQRWRTTRDTVSA